MSSLPLFRGKPLYAKYSASPKGDISAVLEGRKALLSEGKPVRVRMRNQLSPASNSQSPNRFNTTCTLTYASGTTVEVTFSELTVTITHKFADQKVKLSMPNDTLTYDRRSEVRWTRKQAKDASLQAIEDLYELTIVAITSAETESDEKANVETDLDDITRLLYSLCAPTDIIMVFLAGPYWDGALSGKIPDNDETRLAQRYFGRCMPMGVTIVPAAPEVDYHLTKMVDVSSKTIDPIMRLNAIQRWQQRLDDLQGNI